MSLNNTKACLYVANPEFYKDGALKNPVIFNDFYLENHYPQYFSINYDVRITASKKSRSF
jgi:hypothetical protein